MSIVLSVDIVLVHLVSLGLPCSDIVLRHPAVVQLHDQPHVNPFGHNSGLLS